MFDDNLKTKYVKTMLDSHIIYASRKIENLRSINHLIQIPSKMKKVFKLSRL